MQDRSSAKPNIVSFVLRIVISLFAVAIMPHGQQTKDRPNGRDIIRNVIQWARTAGFHEMADDHADSPSQGVDCFSRQVFSVPIDVW